MATVAAMTCLTTATFASAAGLNLSWDDCGAAGVADKDFACDTNSGTHTLVCSLVAPSNAFGVDGGEGQLEVRQWNVPFPSWWDLHNAGSCRETNATLDLTFPGLTACKDSWAGHAIAGSSITSYQVDPNYSSWRRLYFVIAIPSTNRFDMVEGDEYYVAKIVIDNGKTVGSGSCDGCMDGVDVGLRLFAIYRYQASSVIIDYPATRNTVTWQGGKVPTLNRTWGSIKVLYR